MSLVGFLPLLVVLMGIASGSTIPKAWKNSLPSFPFEAAVSSVFGMIDGVMELL